MYTEERRQRRGNRFTRGLGCLSQFVVLVFILLLAYYGSYLLLRGPIPARPVAIAHRGDSAHAPENTLAAFRSAIAAGADWLEMDVQMSDDGHLVVIHDTTVDRTTNGSGRVADFTLAQLQALDAGDGEQIPTFAAVLELAQTAAIGVMPEAKSPQLYPGLEMKIIEALAVADYTGHTVVQSFDGASLARLGELSGDLPLCALYGLGHFDLSGPQPGNAAAVCPMAEMVLLYPWMIRQAHDEGRKVYVWFGALEHPWPIRLLVEFGADGVIADDPGLVLVAWQSR
ncbi:MAG: glycerophosphodiester phosphodiesterase [Chloroflexi bacterium]|nr:glycerophosphodiester phosphodiesterase [Chloroflexota bacterium]